MKVRFLAGVMILAFVLGANACYLRMHLYPVQGPVSLQAPPPVLKGSVSGLKGGTMTVTMMNGEECSGPWESLKHENEVPSSEAMRQAVANAWDVVFGPGFYKAKVLGVGIRVRGTVKGDRGTALTIDGYRQGDDVRAVAFDEHGNIYKVTFN